MRSIWHNSHPFDNCFLSKKACRAFFRKIATIIIILSFSKGFLIGQNLVLNHSFEQSEIRAGTNSGGGQIFPTICPPWFVPNGVGGSPDQCVDNNSTISTMPNYCGANQYAQDGVQFVRAGFHSGDFSEREYLYVELTCPMQAGEEYETSFYVRLGDIKAVGVAPIVSCKDCVGAAFTNTIPDGGGIAWKPFGSLITPNHTSGMIPNDNAWQQVKFNYIAAGGEKFLTVGIFKDNNQVDWVPAITSGTGSGFLHYDNFSVTCVSGCAPPPTPIFSNLPDAICTGTKLSDFPTTSDNGFAGTWSPNINNLNTTEYTFTPEINLIGSWATGWGYDVQCAQVAKKIVVVEDCVVPNFEMTDTILCVGECLDFKDLTTTKNGSVITGWKWTFNGGTPNSSTLQNPNNICFNTPGPHNIKLEVTNNQGLIVDSTIEISVRPPSNASFSYPLDTVCTAEFLVSPTITGNLGGNFTSTPNGLDIFPASGQILPGSSNTGTYNVTYSINGKCPSSSTSEITIIDGPTIDPVQSESICAGDDFTPINFSGIPGATYNWTNSNTNLGLKANGSGNIPSFQGKNTTNNPIVGTIEVSATGVCAGSTASFTLTVMPEEDASFNYSSTTFCANESSRIPNILGASGGSFSNNSTGLSLNTSTGEIDPSNSTIGNHIITYTTSGICPGIENFDIAIVAPPTMNPINDINICDDDDSDPIIFSGSSGATFEWINDNVSIGLAANGVGNLAPFRANNNSSLIQETANVTVTPTLGACRGSGQTFEIIVLPSDDASFQYDVTRLCLSDASILPRINGLPGGVFSSSPNTLSIDSNSGEINPSNSSVGEYIVTYTTNGKCPAEEVFNITLSQVPLVNLIDDQTVCSGESFNEVNFSGTAGADFTWTNTNTNIGLEASGAGNIISFTGINNSNSPESGVIEVTPDLNGCIGSAERFVLSVNPLPIASFELDSSKGCAPLTVGFTSNINFPGDCLWNFGNGETSSDCGSASTTYAEPGTYSVSLLVTDLNGCQGTEVEPDLITVVPAPEAAFVMSSNPVQTSPAVVSFSNNSLNADTYKWDFGDGNSSSLENPKHTFILTQNETSTITLWAHHELCVDSTTQIIEMIEEVVFFVPNAFTPDGNGFNEEFKPVFNDAALIEDFEFFIFNRWGEVTYASSNPEQGWDGTQDDISSPTGVYTWKISFTSVGAQTSTELIGSVTLIK